MATHTNAHQRSPKHHPRHPAFKGREPLQRRQQKMEINFRLDEHGRIEFNANESLCYETITKAGPLIRIKAPKLMGKTSLMNQESIELC